MAINEAQVFQAAAQLLYGVAGAEIDLGATQGGITVTVTGNVADVLIDQLGSIVQVAIDQGDSVEVATKLLQQSPDNILSAFPRVVKNATNTVFWLRTDIGTNAITDSKSLLLKRIVNGIPSASKADWLRFFKARRTGNVGIVYSNGDAWGFDTTWRCFPEERTQLGVTARYIGVFGDETAV